MKIILSQKKSGAGEIFGRLSFGLKAFLILNICFAFSSYAQDAQETEVKPQGEAALTVPSESAAASEEQVAVVEDLDKSKYVTLDFKDADIRNVLKIISYKAGVNIVATPEVIGNVTIRLVDVPWESALDAILKIYGFGYDKQDNIITVGPIEKLTAQKKMEVELSQVQPTITEVFYLKYIDAQDAKKALDPQLSSRGKTTILEMAGQAGWEFGTVTSAGVAKRKSVREEKVGRSKTLIVSDIPPVMDKVKEVIAKIDIKPRQILIETKLIEVNRDKLKDIGFDWTTGTSGISTIGQQALTKGSDIGLHGLTTTGITPSVFNPKSTGLTPTGAGLEIVYRKLTGKEFEAILYALEEDVDTNTLSAPSILALSNQEAAILVGTKYPIVRTEESTQTAGYTVSKSLDYYQDVGIQLNVVPQINEDNYINMVVHPAVTTTSSGVGTLNTTFYPIIDTREAETRVLMKDGETVVIGGLMKDVRGKSRVGVPFLSKIPYLGALFRRDTEDIGKVDLLIFITAHIVKEEEFSAPEIIKLEERLGRGPKGYKDPFEETDTP